MNITTRVQLAVGRELADEFWTQQDTFSVIVNFDIDARSERGTWCFPGTFGATYGRWIWNKGDIVIHILGDDDWQMIVNGDRIDCGVPEYTVIVTALRLLARSGSLEAELANMLADEIDIRMNKEEGN